MSELVFTSRLLADGHLACPKGIREYLKRFKQMQVRVLVDALPVGLGEDEVTSGEGRGADLLPFAGIWEDVSAEEAAHLIEELYERRAQSQTWKRRL